MAVHQNTGGGSAPLASERSVARWLAMAAAGWFFAWFIAHALIS
jgi:hypothetical protein